MKIRKIISIFLMLCAAVCIAVAGAGLGGCKKDKPKTYVLSYESGADDAEGVAPEAVSYAEGEKITLAAADTFTRSGYTFEKWSYGGSTYAAGEEFAMPASDVTFTALWKEEAPAPSEKDEPTLTELSGKFYGAENWVFMTNNGGAATDAGEVAYTLNDGSIKFHRLNQAIEAGDFTNSTVSFMLKGTNDWSIWFNSSSKDNNDNYSYRLAYANGGLRLALSSAPDLAAAVVADSSYEKAEWNRIDIVFETKDKTCKIKLYINGERASLVAGDNVSGVTVSENVLTHAQPAMFKTGNYIVVKVWEAHNVLQLKPVAKKDVKDVPVVACIGASITQGAGLPDEYADSYPAQLQQKLGGGYNVLNFGNSGKTVTLTPNDGEPWLEQYQWEGVRSTVPDYAIFNIGTNDSKEANLTGSTLEERKAAFKTAFEHLLDEVVSVNTEMKIYICTVPYAYSNVCGINNKNIDEIIAPVQREVAKENGYTLIDIYEYSKNKSLLFRDGVHPHKNGFTMFAEIIEKILTEGDGAITEEYLASIDAKYNDKLTNFHAKIAIDGDKINLVVSGDTTLAATAQIKIAVGDDNGYKYFPAAIADGKFAASIDLTEFDYDSRWYNVQAYVYDETYYPEENTFFHLMLLADTDGYTAGQIFRSDSKQVKLASWNSGWGATLSISSISDYHFIELTDATLAEADGKINLTLSGGTGDDNLRLYIGNAEDNKSFYHDIAVSGGEFTVTYDLVTLAPDGSWYNVRIYFADNSYFTVTYTAVKKADGAALTTSDAFKASGIKISIKTWGSENPLSLAVEAYDDSYSIVADEVKMEAGKLVFKGTAQNVTELIVALVDNADEVYGNGTDGKVEMGADGKFTVEIELSKLTANAGNWYYLRTKANGAEGWSYVDYTKTADKFIFGERVYRWEYANNGIAVAYSEYKGPTVTLDGATVEQSGNSVMLNISGSLTEISDLYDKTLLYIGNDASNESNYHEVTKNGDAFTASFDLATLSFGSGMQIRFYHSRTDGGAKWGWYTLKFEEVTCGGEVLAEGKSFELDGKKITFTTSANWKPVEVKVEDTTFEWAVNDVKFENGSLLVGGITSNVTSLEVTLKEKTQTFKETANIQPDGSYAVGFDLTALTKTGEWYKLYVSVNGGNEVQVEYYEGFDTTVKYVYGKYSYKFTTEWSNTKFALVMSNRSYNYGITSATISEVDGKATLTLEGTIDGDIAAADIMLLLDKTSEVKEKLTVQNTATEAGKFSFSYDVSGLLLSTKTT